MAASDDDAVYCICRRPYDSSQFMIECDVCKDWFHGKCIDVKEYQATDIENYHCPNCRPRSGPIVLKQRHNWHRHDYADRNQNKPVQTGTVVFIKELKTRAFCSSDEIPVLRVPGANITVEAFIADSFTRPFLVDRKDGLGLTVPPPTFSVDDVESYVGSSTVIDVIDVTRQEDYKMALCDWAEYYSSPNRKKIYNVISLEFSSTRLSELVIAPRIVRQLSWASTSWPAELPHDCSYTRPAVQKYCLMGVKDSYTDFHVDFGGSSVWYHILRGEKVFYLIAPTPGNLALYEAWHVSPNRSETFFGDQVEKCHRCVVKQGQTIFLPSGWIHAVFTPIDSLVFGGNFLHDFNIEMQIQIYEMERRVKTAEKFMFPCFETSHWYKAKIILDYIKDCNDTQKLPHRHMLEGGKAIAAALKSWTKRKDFVKTAKYEVPEHITYNKLLRDLNKELKLYDAVSPESSPKRTKRKRKKESLSEGEYEKLTNLKKETERKIEELEKHRGKLKGKKKRNKKETVSLKVRLPKPRVFRDSTSDATPEKKAKVQLNESPAAKTRLKLKVSKGKIVSQTTTDSSPTPEKKRKTDRSVKSVKSEKVVKSEKIVKSDEPRTPKKSKSGKKKISKRTKKFNNVAVKSEKEECSSVTKLETEETDDTSALVMDETPKKTSKTKPLPRSSPVKSGSLKLRLSFHGHKLSSDVGQGDRGAVGRGDRGAAAQGDKGDVGQGDIAVSDVAVSDIAVSDIAVSDIAVSDIAVSDIAASDTPSQGSSSDTKRSPKKPGHKGKGGAGRATLPEIRGGLNGSISDILEASGYGTEPEIKIDPDNEYVASPGTRDAIQGMLSMHNSARIPHSKDVYDFDDEEERLQACYKDKDYYYPSLEVSDDEGKQTQARLRDTEDSTWNPRALVNVTQSVPRDKLPRDSAKRESVGNTLAVTALKLHDTPSENVVKKKRVYAKRKKKVEKVKEAAQVAVTEPVASTSSMIPPSAEQLEAHFKRSLASPTSPIKTKRPKKGFATAKQRLGKILKIHKMVY